ncbi:MAG: DUF4097 family beta strand repeat-containing protein [Pyrinomonadaceae bacterium]
MNWLYSIVLAGLMFTTESELLPLNQHNYKNHETSSIVKFDETERFEQTYPFSPNGRVNVSNVNGSITVEAWDRNEIKLEAIKTADTRENLADVEIKIDARQDSFSVEADYDNARNGTKQWKNYRKLEVQFRLSVPRTAVLNEIETVNGSVTVSDFVNYTKISAVNGEVKATNLRGSANLSTVNGSVEAAFDRLEKGTKISLTTVNGRVNLMIPSDSNATVTADTLNGSINNDFGLPVRKGEYVGKDLYGKIGSGDVPIRLNSVNGGLTIARKNDGKSLNPATNLLPQKRTGSDDDNEGRNRVNTVKMNKEIAKAVVDSQKEAAKAAKEVEKELERLAPELEKITQDAIKQSAEAVKRTSEMMNSPEFKEKMRQAERSQRDALSRLSSINWVSGTPTVEKKSETFTVKGIPKVTVNAKGCAVTVRGWDKSEVSYSVKKFSRSRNQPPVELTVDHTDATVNLTVANENKSGRTTTYFGDNSFDDNHSVSVEVYVPKKSNLRITADGEIRLEGVTGEIELNGADESINVRDSGGKLRVAVADGRIRIVGFSGELDAKSIDGETYLEGDFVKLSARTVDGSIVLTLPENADFNVESNAKDVMAYGFALEFLGDGNSTSRWKVGKGGTTYSLNSTADGKISVRNKNTLVAGN